MVCTTQISIIVIYFHDFLNYKLFIKIFAMTVIVKDLMLLHNNENYESQL